MGTVAQDHCRRLRPRGQDRAASRLHRADCASPGGEPWLETLAELT